MDRPSRDIPRKAVRGEVRQRRRSELLEAAERAIRRAGPATSMEQVAAEAGITKPILYKHFGDKRGLYDALIHRYADRLLAELESALATESRPRQRIGLTIDAYLRLIESEPMAYRFLVHRAVMEQPNAQAMVAGFTRHLAQRIAEVLRAEFSRAGLEARAVEAYAHGLVGMVHQAGDWWLSQKDVSRAELVERLVQWVWRGFHGLGDPSPERPSGI